MPYGIRYIGLKGNESMKQIVPGNQALAALCGEQKKENRRYRLTKHCIQKVCEDGTLLYHTLTGELLLLEDGEEIREQEEALVSKWFAVPEAYDENRFADEIRTVYRMMRPQGGAKTVFTILTTTDCNARCYYCYEMGIRRLPMTDETAHAAADYIARVSRGEKVRLRWFGGEPLYNRRAIDLICRDLKEKQIVFESSMISNGYYLDRETVRDAVTEWQLRQVQITIDGTEKVYNRTKAYIDRDGSSPYERVMQNIRTALDAGIRVHIRLNMDAGNAGDLLHLTEDLEKRFQGCENLGVYVAIIHEFAGKIHAYRSLAQKEADYFAIRERLKQSGLLRKGEDLPSAMRNASCIADNDAGETILPDGRVGRCEHFSESMITGDLYHEERDPDVTRKWKERLVVPACRDCALYPRCRRLAMCEWNRDGCDELERRIDRIRTEEQMLKAYHDRKKEETKHETD